MKFILNEKKYAENCINNNRLDKDNIYQTLVIMAQYYYDCTRFRKTKITELLIEYLQQTYPRYKQDAARWDKTCARIATHTGGKKTKLLELDGVPIYRKEMETIKGINDKTTQRLAFTMLCIAKLNSARNPKNNGWLNLGSKAIFDAAAVTGSAKIRDLKLHQMMELGLIEFTKKINKTNIRITYMCTDDDAETAMVLSESDFLELGLYYQYNIYDKHDTIGKCEKCQRYYMRRKANRYRLASKQCTYCIVAEEQNKQAKTEEKKCVDCGKLFNADARANKKIRCDECQSKWRKMNDRNRKKKP